MTVASDTLTTLQSLAGGRVYPDIAPHGAALPYIVCQQVGGQSPTFMERASPSKANARMQVTVWSRTRIQAETISRQAEAAMVEATIFDAKPLGDQIAEYDEDTGLRGSRQDFSVWFDR